MKRSSEARGAEGRSGGQSAYVPRAKERMRRSPYQLGDWSLYWCTGVGRVARTFVAHVRIYGRDCKDDGWVWDESRQICGGKGGRGEKKYGLAKDEAVFVCTNANKTESVEWSVVERVRNNSGAN